LKAVISRWPGHVAKWQCQRGVHGIAVEDRRDVENHRHAGLELDAAAREEVGQLPVVAVLERGARTEQRHRRVEVVRDTGVAKRAADAFGDLALVVTFGKALCDAAQDREATLLRLAWRKHCSSGSVKWSRCSSLMLSHVPWRYAT
jgi:hypothetical protein